MTHRLTEFALTSHQAIARERLPARSVHAYYRLNRRWRDIGKESSSLVNDTDRPPDDDAHRDESVDKQRSQNLTDAPAGFGIV